MGGNTYEEIYGWRYMREDIWVEKPGRRYMGEETWN